MGTTGRAREDWVGLDTWSGWQPVNNGVENCCPTALLTAAFLLATITGGINVKTSTFRFYFCHSATDMTDVGWKRRGG